MHVRGEPVEITPGSVYTLSEAAEHLRLTNRGVAKLARQYGLCMVRGRDILLTGADIEGIKDVLRVQPKSPPLPKVKPFPSDHHIRESLMRLTAKKMRKRRP